MFSIIVPSYNRNAEVQALLHSLEQQTVKNFEVVIIDDCSPQAVEIHEKFTFPVKLFRNAVNQGAAGSRNIGAEQASNEWLLFLDDDDRFDDRKCALLAKAIEENDTANLIYHPAKCVMVNEGFEYITKPILPENLTLDNLLMANKMGGMPMLAVKKSFFFALGGLETGLKSLEDYEFVLKLVSSPQLNAVYLAQPLSICTFHTKRASVSTHSQNTELALNFIQQRYVKTVIQAKNFALNSLYILSYPYAMSLSRQAASYYFKMFQLSHSIKHLIIAMVICISPKLAMNLKRFL
ncbi:glycosyltransferase family 2 protein [Conservatibacter flavescens]|uniref:Glycosyltransferase n=1 Tax=Conservatibacter flavescens TaxID=28161 RepID=A0A2M8S296_9PAST|nr:glycosyltransferase family 2 protein [Conservatibacter flavescens]PJG85226.1 glycosyltransferase [Conservatibacter flavescens]